MQKQFKQSNIRRGGKQKKESGSPGIENSFMDTNSNFQMVPS